MKGNAKNSGKKVPRNKINQHMSHEWDMELPVIKKAVMQGDILSSHVLERMEQRNISILNLATAIMQSEIVEGFDIGKYPKYRNKTPRRTLMGVDDLGRTLKIGVAIDYKGNQLFVESIVTVYEFKEGANELVG